MSLEPLPEAGLCRVCGLPGPAGLSEYRCELCVEHPPHFTIARSFGEYGGALRELLHLLKYGGMEPLAKPLGKRMAAVARREAFAACQAVVPVPLDPERKRQRGYNQAELLASAVARELGLPMLAARSLRRVRPTTTQTGLSRTQRRENVKDAFVADKSLVAGRIILLVDDVMTTGATLDSCARALCTAAAREVLALTVARTPAIALE